MHVLILNQTFYPDVASTGQLMWDVARHLSDAGHRVTVVTSSYFYGTDRSHKKRLEIIGNIQILRVAQTGFGKKHFLGRVLDFASFYISAAWELTRQKTPDVILALTSPPMISTLAMLARQFFRKPDGSPVRLVYHVMDLYPDAAIAPGVIREHSLPARFFGTLTERTLALSDAVIALGRDMRDRLLHRYPRGAPADRIHVIPPWAEADLLQPMNKADNPLARQLRLTDTFNLVYSGNLGIAHDLQTMMDAIDRTRGDATLKWIFIGGGRRFDELKQSATAHHWQQVVFLPFQDRSQLNISLNLADVHLISQLPAFTGVVVPSKLFGIMAVGKPSLMIGPAAAEVARIIDEHQLGFVIANGDVDGLLNRITELRQSPALCQDAGRRARQVFARNYDRDVACANLQAILEQVVNSESTPNAF